MILITGGAGFIGSNLVASLNESGIDDIVIADDFSSGPDQWKNLAKRRFRKLVHTTGVQNEALTAIIHLGAITDTQTTDTQYVLKVNYAWSIALLEECQRIGIPFIYASSASVYGDGSNGFLESAIGESQTPEPRPLSLYAWSKVLFDRYVSQILQHRTLQNLKAPIVGLRFFNVYGPNEYHKGPMGSVIAQQYDQFIAPLHVARLFEPPSSKLAIARDFVYIDDVVATIRWFLDHPDVSGIFNVGTGQARSFEALVEAAGVTTIKHVPFPDRLRNSYQFHTCADLTRLRKAGCHLYFRPIEEGVREYVRKYLSNPEDRYR